MSDLHFFHKDNEQPVPLVSVVIPAYNQAHFLGGAIRSALGQTFRDFEVIVVDDGSTDDTAAVALAFGAAVRYVWQVNQGLAGARNTGLLQARGSLVGLLDSDDEWKPDYLEKMATLAAQNPQASVFYCTVDYMDEAGRDTPQTTLPPQVPAERLYWRLLRHNFLVPSTILMRRQPVVEAGLFDPDFRRLQDWELWLRMLRLGYGFVGTLERLVRYRLHGDSLSGDPIGGRQAAAAMARKLFGPEEGAAQDWAWDKRRAFGGVYRYHTLSAVQYQADWEAGAACLERALEVDPSLALDEDLFYELALGAQPMGVRGTSRQLPLDENAQNLERLLASATRRLPPTVRRQALGSGYYSLGMLAYNRGSTALSRRCLAAAARFRPELALNGKFAAYLARALVGASVVRRLRRLRQSNRTISGGARSGTG